MRIRRFQLAFFFKKKYPFSWGKRGNPKATSALFVNGRKTFIGMPPLLHLVVTGWDCEQFASACLDSIGVALSRLELEPRITVVNDGSEDNTGESIRKHWLASKIRLVENSANHGAAFSRHVGIREESRPDSIIVCIDLDDWILPEALVTIQNVYWANPKVWATFGNWIDPNGRLNPQSFYTGEEIEENLHRSVVPFNGTHIRTFRRFLYDGVEDVHLQDVDGKWFRVCTDVALVLPLLDQCGLENVAWIAKPLYVYRKHSAQGTIARYGAQVKSEAFEEIRSRPPLSRYEEKQC